MSLVEFEKQKVVESFMEACDVYYTNVGGYHYSKDGSPCYYLNGMLTMFEEQQKNIDLLVKEITETQAFLNKQNRIKQTKIDELQARIDEALNTLCKLQYSSGERIYNDVGSILKGNKDEK